MSIIERNNLVSAITMAYNKLDYNTYEELLNIFYKLLEQEDINNEYLNKINTYESISNDAQELLQIKCIVKEKKNL